MVKNETLKINITRDKIVTKETVDSVECTINGQPAREAAKNLRCMLCRAPISLNDFARRNVVWEREGDDEWFVSHELCARFERLSDEEQDRWIEQDPVWRQERSYRSDLESKGRRKGITREDFKELLISAVITEIQKLYFTNLCRSPGEKVHSFDIEVSVRRIPEEEQKQYLDREIINEADERMGMLLKAKRI